MAATALAPAAPKAARRRAASATEHTATSKPLSLRVDAGTQFLIDRAAESLGQTRTEFMLASARERATEVLLNRTLFVLGGNGWKAFAEALNEPPLANIKLKALLSRKAPWDESLQQVRRRKAV